MLTSKSHIFLFILVLFLIISGIGSASASKEIVVTLPSNTISLDEVMTIPVIMYDAQEITSFEIEVLNDVPGVIITLNTSHPLNEVISTSTYVNQNSQDRSRQLVYWYDAAGMGVTRESLTLFYVDIIADKTAGSTIPVNLNVKVLGDKEDLVDITPLYYVKNGSITFLQGTNVVPTPILTAVTTPSLTPAMTAVPSVSPGEENDPNIPVTTPEQKVPTSSQPTPMQTPTQSSSFPIVGIISVLLASLYHFRRH